MKRFTLAAPLGGAALVIAALLLVTGLNTNAQESPPRWEAVETEVAVGKGVRIAVRLAGTDGAAFAGTIAVTSTRLDMGPDGMAMMEAPLRPVAGQPPATLAFDTDLVMAGRWALAITATVDGFAEPVSGTVIFTAIEKHSAATPAASTSGAKDGERRIVYYRNPMGLPDVSPVPKKDTMGMDYIPVYEDEVSDGQGTVRIAPEKVQRAGVRTAVVERRSLTRGVRAVGTIVADESKLAALAVKFDGFVEELFVPVTGMEVKAGDPLARVWIESPEILRKQSDYLAALRGSGAASSRDSKYAENNLRLFGIPDPVIARLRATREPVRSIVLTAAAGGTVLEKPALNGMRFAAGDPLFKIAELSTVWVMAEVSERDLGALKIGQAAKATLRAYPGETFEGRVAFIYPEFNIAARTATVRIEVPNGDRRLKLGQYGDVTIAAALSGTPVVAVPESAIIDSGTRRVAFVDKGEGVFEPRDLAIGGRGNGFVEIRDGLAEGERIVVSGNFLIDAESNLRAALASFAAAEPVP